MKGVGTFMANLSILRPNGIFYGHFGTFCGHLVYFWYVVPRKIWQPCVKMSTTLLHLRAVFKGG
jgi:hypothetical protein